MPEFDAALAALDWQALHDLGHWLKGSSGSVGIDALVPLALALEQAADARDDAVCSARVAEIADLLPAIVEANGTVSSAGTASAVTEPTASYDDFGDTADTPVESTLPVWQPGFRDVVEKFLIRMQAQIETMQDAVDREDYKALADLGHWLRGSAGSVGYAGFTELADRLEQHAKQESDSVRNDVIAIAGYAERVYRGWDVQSNQQKSA